MMATDLIAKDVEAVVGELDGIPFVFWFTLNSFASHVPNQSKAFSAFDIGSKMNTAHVLSLVLVNDIVEENILPNA